MTERKFPHDAYPVRTVARLTGLSTDVIRAWERRYGVIAPVRGPRGARLYSREDVAHLRLLAGAVALGRTIGDVAALDSEALEALAGHPPAALEQLGRTDLLARMLESLTGFDQIALDRQLGDALIALGSAAFVRQVAAPLLIEVGERESDGRLSIAHEHLISALIRNLLSSLMRSRGRAGQPALLLATPSGERHEFGLLLVALLVLDAGLGLLYLGADLPAAEIVAAARQGGVAAVGIGMVAGVNRMRAVGEVRAVERGLPAETELWLGGGDAAAVAGMLERTRALVLDDLGLVEREAARLRLASIGLH